MPGRGHPDHLSHGESDRQTDDYKTRKGMAIIGIQGQSERMRERKQQAPSLPPLYRIPAHFFFSEVHFRVRTLIGRRRPPPSLPMDGWLLLFFPPRYGWLVGWANGLRRTAAITLKLEASCGGEGGLLFSREKRSQASSLSSLGIWHASGGSIIAWSIRQ